MLRERIGQGVILSTRNRAEVYIAVEDLARGAEQVRDFMAGFHGLTAEDLAPYLHHTTNAEAAHHLFRVAALHCRPGRAQGRGFPGSHPGRRPAFQPR